MAVLRKDLSKEVTFKFKPTRRTSELEKDPGKSRKQVPHLSLNFHSSRSKTKVPLPTQDSPPKIPEILAIILRKKKVHFQSYLLLG